MKNYFFDAEMLHVLLNPSRWTVVSSLLPPEVSLAVNPHHEAWARQHSHKHPWREILVALKGNTYYGFCDKLYRCHPGSIFFIESFDNHSNGYPDFSPDVDHLLVIIIQERVFVYMRSIRNRKKFSSYDNLNRVFTEEEIGVSLNRSWRTVKNTKETPPQLVRMKLISALSSLIAEVVESGLSKSKVKDKVSNQKKVIQTTKNHILETGGDTCTLDNLAHIAGYSKYHFLRIFKKQTGETVHQYVNDCRLRKIREMLKTGCSYKHIALDLGFSSQSAFSQWFKPWKYLLPDLDTQEIPANRPDDKRNDLSVEQHSCS